MLTQPHLLLNTPHLFDGEERRSVYMSQEQNALSALIHPRASRARFLFRFVGRLPRLLHLFLLPVSPYLPLLLLLALKFFYYFVSLSRLLHRYCGSQPLRRRNVPIKSESHVLPISRQLNLVHARIAAIAAAVRALCQGTGKLRLDRRTLDEYSVPNS